MMFTVRIVAFLHLTVYLGIMWYGWQSYKLLRKKSWTYMGVGFTIFLVYRIRQFIRQMIVDYPIDTESTLIPFIASIFLLMAFKMLSAEHHGLLKTLAVPALLRSGAQPVEYWLENFRAIVREEVAAASGMTTVTVKGPSATLVPTDTKKEPGA